jgi:hypothetical protein
MIDPSSSSFAVNTDRRRREIISPSAATAAPPSSILIYLSLFKSNKSYINQFVFN